MEECIFFVHDAWHTPEHYRPYFSALLRSGFRVCCPLLPTCNQSKPLCQRLTHLDVMLVRITVESIVNKRIKLIIIMHGYGGIVGSQALEGLALNDRAAHGKKGGVVHLIYMCAYLLPVSKSMQDIIQHRVHCGYPFLPAVNEAETEWGPQSYQKTLFGDVSLKERKRCLPLMVGAPGQILTATTTQAAWRDIPFTYLFTRNDLALHHLSQRMMTDLARLVGRPFREKRYDAGHSVFLTHTKEMVQEVQAICGVFWQSA